MMLNNVEYRKRIIDKEIEEQLNTIGAIEIFK